MTALAELDDALSSDEDVAEEQTNNTLLKTADPTEAAPPSQEPNFCGVDMDEMTLPCGMGGAAATATLPRELISRLSLLQQPPDSFTTTDNNNNNNNDLVSSLYNDQFACLCGPGQLSEDENDPIPSSVLSDPNRSICVVTTAALPWRTGTAVNPLLRALYLVRFQRERTGGGNTGGESDGPSSKGSVALVIPWLESSEEREKLYGTTNKFSNGPQGMNEQELWIKQYAKDRCNMELEANELKYIWYPAFYLAGFGSIFPKVDLCNYIPSELVDVAILEEPEHLNWFRMPDDKKEGRSSSSSASASSSSGCVSAGTSVDAEEQPQPQQPQGGGEKEDVDGKEEDDNVLNEQIASSLDGGDSSDDESITLNDHHHPHHNHHPKVENMQHNKLGWTHRFLFVVGIVHTNYEEYARQYGIGASLIAAPAIGALSALTMRAYCHQVIKLSNTLPSFAPGKECTCNVHGVRREFLEDGGGSTADNGDKLDSETSPVYFIGKLVWAKGFDVMIELQELFRKKTGDYFKIDIYGGGPDETAITRAFHGRNHVSPSKRPTPPKDPSSEMSAAPTDPKDLNAAAVFANPNSLKTLSDETIEQMKQHRPRLGSEDVISQYLSLGFEISASRENITYVKEDREPPNKSTDPLHILSDLSGKSFSTGVKTSHALYNIADSSIKEILTLSFGKMKKKVNGGGEDRNFVFDPPKSRYELRRHPIPAMFPGVIDHAQLNNPSHKIFLNPSTSEVLCTTSAEALAMGKFVILPNHPSNEFFLQFTNCLAYDTLEECAEKLQFALENEPSPLSPEERRIFTWEAATERLMDSSLISIKEARERASNGMDKTDARIAFWLAESGKIGKIFHNK
eukprot:CAMPEP_0201720200 /NCGR_PEP_ID=MMETSP0593-20130828/5211_1 /ASSEMBLY_ACC=CAM_ASM_000672 /TAXON_ID=267983 /ORGANISM="Skeletonema japonicum, Strain CCMP2506" /LENGTH=854 /DNA_ID=CAMNT_0048210807 /DNA_START=65 /DNA_END=2629 /DNA_ORIENTATION=-